MEGESALRPQYDPDEEIVPAYGFTRPSANSPAPEWPFR
jgi:hypothetical protein